MGKLIVASNRLPVTVVKSKGEFKLQTSVGGLATGLSSLNVSYNQLWIGWPGIDSERIKDQEEEIETRLQSEGFYPVFLSKDNIRGILPWFLQ